MPSILLHAPAIDNGGEFRDAGSEIEVGADQHMIDEGRATQLLNAAGAAQIDALAIDNGGKGPKKSA